MGLSDSDRIISSVCEEFAGALLSLPSTWHKSRISLVDVEAAALCLGWDASPSHVPSQSSEERLDTSQLLSLSFVQLRSKVGDRPLVVSTYSGSQWTGTSKRSTEQMPSDTPLPQLPDGLAELLSQIERAYNNDPQCSLSAAEVVRAISDSEHLVTVFPQIIRFAVAKIRTDSRLSDISPLLNLLEALIGNSGYAVSSQGEFEILLNCLVEVVVDCNLASPLEARRQAVEILSRLLELKVGRFHSATLLSDLVNDVFISYISSVSSLKTVPDGCLVAGLAGAVLAVHRLSGEAALGDVSKQLARFLKSHGGQAPEASRVISECITNL